MAHWTGFCICFLNILFIIKNIKIGNNLLVKEKDEIIVSTKI